MVECGRLGSVLTHLPLFCLPLATSLYLLAYPSTSFALFPDLPWLSLAYPMATLGLSWAPLGLVPVLVPYLFSWLVPGLLLAISWLLLGLALGCPVLHLLYMGLRPVTCPVPGSGASGICTLILRYLYS